MRQSTHEPQPFLRVQKMLVLTADVNSISTPFRQGRRHFFIDSFLSFFDKTSEIAAADVTRDRDTPLALLATDDRRTIVNLDIGKSIERNGLRSARRR